MASTSWEKICVGDALVVRADEELPADIVVLASSGEEGNCYVSTANLDGETNLKLKTAPSSMQTALVGIDSVGVDEADAVLAKALTKLQSMKATAQAEKPTNSIHSFSGSLRVGDIAEEALNPKQLLLRGTMLRNTVWCIGIVVYTGKDTRVVMNSRKAPLKVSNLERIVNQSMVVIFVVQGVLAVISAACFTIHSSTYRGYWYLYPGGAGSGIILPEPIGYWITFFILYSNMMPISLYATIEFCNAAQAMYIKCDAQMYDREFDFPAMVRSTNLIQELGQVQYIFSDKTGTLTQNVMELKCVSIASKAYGHVGEEKGFQGACAIEEARRRDPADRDAIDAFFEVLSVSHTVMVTTDKKGKVKFEAESPDEDALVSATSQMGYVFMGRQGHSCWVDVKTEPGKTTRRTYTTVAVNAFSSARKRMSVIVKRDNGEHYLFIKGADNVMLDRAVGSEVQLQAQLDGFARQGLRTLVIGRRKLLEDEVTNWMRDYEKALVAIEDREGCLERVAEKIETRLELLGATAIEDKLQVGVSTTIVRLRRGGIKLWVLTGDKLETARNIGFSTRVLTDDMDIMILDIEGKEDARALQDKLEAMLPRTEKATTGQVVCGIMVTGQALERLMGSGMEDKFLEIAQRCSVVIACRVSPLQKAQMVQLVRGKVKPTPVTLAVGDGANDVPMIQEAQVGVGICGREGRQAVNSADFAIGQFRFLQRLLLVHGRLDYLRTCKFILYTFWRNVMQVLLMFYYSFWSGYSGVSIFEDKVRMTFNVILFLPIVATGIFDRDMEDRIALSRPELYENGRLGLELNRYKMCETVVSALLHSLGILAISTLAFSGMSLQQAGDYYTYGTAVYSLLIIASNYRVAFMTITWNWVSIAMQVISFGGYTIFLAIYGVWRTIEPPFFSVPYHMASNAPFWVCCFSVPALSLYFDTAIWYVWKELRPSRRDLLLEKQAAGLLGKLNSGADAGCGGDRPGAFVSGGSGQLRAGAHGGPASPTLIGQPADVPEDSDRDNLLRNSKGEVIMRTHEPANWAFVQERLPSWQFILTWRRAAGLMLLPGGLLMLLGAIGLASSRMASQIRIHYDGQFYDGPPGSKVDEVFDIPCTVGSSCTAVVTAYADMEPPILVYYAVDPFFQNYNHYVRSVSSAQMSGKTPSSLQTCKDSLSNVYNGEDMVPCGLRALGMFNDTFEVLSHPLDTTGVAWAADVDYYTNPPDYSSRPNTSWLYRRFPTIPGLKAEGVKNEAFATWARPSAMPNVQKPYGYLRSPLKAGDTVTVRINASFPVASLSARKELVLTSLTNMGGRDDSLGLFLLIAGGICILSGILVVLQVLAFPRAPGDPGPFSSDLSIDGEGANEEH
uniref:Phospholipid-transporting ATPase n=1 Tax=Alexandrium catenella TaxID=2925 RepID=A0A7S1RD31_ALECA